MNRSINILLLVVSFPAIAFVIIVGFDLPIDLLHYSGANIPYRGTVFICFAVVLLLLMLRRSIRRWVGVGMMRKEERFIWCVPIGAARKRQVTMYLIIEAIVALFYAISMYVITTDSWVVVCVYLFMFLDQLVFLFVATPWFRVGITQKALVVADREVRVLYFSGLRRVEVQQQTIYFEYIEELQLFFPTNCIPQGSYAPFREALEGRVNRDRVYFSEKFKELE